MPIAKNPVTNIINSVFKITGVKPKTLDQCKAEMMNYLRSNNAEGLVIEYDNIILMLELCHVYKGGPYSDLINDKVIEEVEALYNGQEEVFERVGKVFDFTKLAKDAEIVNKLADNIIKLHPDLHYKLISKKHYVSFYDNDGLIFEYGELMNISNSNDMSGIVIFRRLNKKDYKEIVQPYYLKSKTWDITQQSGKDIIKSSFYTFAELLDLLQNRKLITYGNYI